MLWVCVTDETTNKAILPPSFSVKYKWFQETINVVYISYADLIKTTDHYYILINLTHINRDINHRGDILINAPVGLPFIDFVKYIMSNIIIGDACTIDIH